jgi:hypothetical protein
VAWLRAPGVECPSNLRRLAPRAVPASSGGRLWEDLWIDPEDWVDDVLPEVAGRAG